eukprot:c27065_g1_i1 orf=122-538(+)
MNYHMTAINPIHHVPSLERTSDQLTATLVQKSILSLGGLGTLRLKNPTRASPISTELSMEPQLTAYHDSKIDMHPSPTFQQCQTLQTKKRHFEPPRSSHIYESCLQSTHPLNEFHDRICKELLRERRHHSKKATRDSF